MNKLRKHGVYYDSRIKLLLILLTSALAFALGGGLTGLLLFGVVCLFPFLFFSNQTLEQYAGMFGESYLGILQTLVSPVTAIIMLVVVAICAFVGALNAKKLLKKHFKKAGMV